MKKLIEHIFFDGDLIIHSKYILDTNSGDEDGADYEYDFTAFMNNQDDIKKTILRLYGERGFIDVVKQFAGVIDGLVFEPIEYEENASILHTVRTLQAKEVEENKTNSVFVDMRSTKIDLAKENDQLFLITGIIDALPVNDDLNVMKMLGSEAENSNEEFRSKCLGNLDVETKESIQDARFFQFSINSNEYLVAVKRSNFFGILCYQDAAVIQYPENEVQRKIHRLFEKYINIDKAIKLKKSIIFEVSYSDEAIQETSRELPRFRLLYNVETAKIESKEIILE